jgi:hypothetical protein
MRTLYGAFLAITLVTLSACGSAPPGQFAEFAKLGTALTDSTPPLLDVAFAEAVSADSIVLSQARTTLVSPEERLDMLEKSSALLRDRLAIYADLTRHSRLLRSYFVTLGLLADTSGDSAIGDGAKGIVDQLSALHPRLKDAQVGDFAVADFVKAAAPVAVGAFRSVALQRELEARADAITEELDLQQAVLTAIAEQMRSDIGLRLQKQNRERIEMPFVDPGDLPDDWTERRVNSLKTPITLAAIEAAAAASENLRVSFVALSEGGGAGGSLSQLLQDVSTVVSLVETLKKSPQP